MTGGMYFAEIKLKVKVRAVCLKALIPIAGEDSPNEQFKLPVF
jgi:hypothetical protein